MRGQDSIVWGGAAAAQGHGFKICPRNNIFLQENELRCTEGQSEIRMTFNVRNNFESGIYELSIIAIRALIYFFILIWCMFYLVLNYCNVLILRNIVGIDFCISVLLEI